MEEKTKRRVTVAFTIFLGITYFFLFATPLPRPLSLKPRWVATVPEAQAFPKGETGTVPLSFEIGERYGYFDRSKGLLFSATRGYGVSITDSGFVAWDMKPQAIAFRDPRGGEAFVTQDAGYPFMDGGRRFLISPNQSSVTEYGPAGAILWKRDFPAIVTAFASNKDIAVFGTLDGELYAIDRGGKELLSFAPGGSRISCIYGCAVSPDGQVIAATSGLDKQRVVVLEKREEAYRVTWHRWTDSDFRRPVAMAFTVDGRELVFETSGGFGVYDVGKRKEHVLAARDPLVASVSIPARDMLLALDDGTTKDIIAASYGGRRYFEFPFVADVASIRSVDNSLFLGLRAGDASALLRLDFVEE